ncbi:hypothetical protein B9G53_22840 [Pseudanabaena sp. SR411]|uniref:hypothetical protein n=1 Tax=Pseudanabaena sp. SR411 TaxID=1980935 RepID=UPI000B984FFD|nr:hypothetical protein [Pseudanabaena sp. SR411]OYQ62310.1 hypothetical protein B9G53_22840 [Pseudanabaena sp. SR411]
MNKNKKLFVQKFEKENSICNICESEKKLTEDHVPPKSCVSVSNRAIYLLSHTLTGDNSFKPRLVQNGITYKTICAKCNNDLGKYDKYLLDLKEKIEVCVKSKLILPDTIEVECCPNAIMRSVLGHILSARTGANESIIDSIIRSSIKNSLLPIDDDIHIFYWVYPYQETVIFRDFSMSAIRGKLDECHRTSFFSLIKFYPLAFLVAYDLPVYSDLLSLHEFNHIKPEDKMLIKVDLKLHKQNFPEVLDGFDFIVFGRSANDSVYSIPNYKTINK